MAINALGTIVIEKARALLMDSGFVARHRAHEKAFTRKRSLTFDRVMLLVLQKTLKSTQLHLQEFFGMLTGSGLARAVTPSAWTQSRAKLKHTAFIELNQVAILEPVYTEQAKNELSLWHGHRLLPVDSSVVRMPESKALFAFFDGQEQIINQSGVCAERIPQARLSVIYDCLNRIVLDARVGKYTQSEHELLLKHLGSAAPGDVLVLDRGYASYLLLAEMASRGLHFIVRCNRQSFAQAGQLFKDNKEGVSVTVTLPAKTRRAEAKAAGLPLELKVRFVTVRLSTGELEVLVTSLLDEQTYPTDEFREVYHLRWGVETFYGLIKGRLDLENFSGLTPEAVLQDIHAAVFLANLESVVTREASTRLPQAGENGRRYGQKINHAVSLHALKSKVIDLLLGERPADKVLAELTEIFLANPVLVRSDRTPPPRRETPRVRIINFIKRIRKVVF
jgi:hypothetical protein